MINKSILATAIVAPVLVGYLLLQIEYSFFSVSGGASRTLQKEAEKVLISLEEPKEAESFIEADIGDLEVLFQVAKNIYGSEPRNKEYAKLVDLSIAENKPGFAFVVAENVYGSADRNEQYYKIVQACLKLEKYTLALAVANKIYGSTERNKVYSEVIEAGIRKRNSQVASQPEPSNTTSSSLVEAKL
ncbi:hypothetical protein [Vibrio anguillarum]|uniref:Uncharacterized protein n=1 Tax=Vibrio anguillarum TaxID=55601 RepID=A0ABD4QYU8_VIBAN|nr:hypothetical protein [Vibrio anguillarum]MBT2920462.1 hypothetical protein [Vibrio anguillarum]